MKKTVLGFILILTLASMAQAATVSYVDSPMWNTAALTGFETTGAMMNGMTVTAYLGDGTSQMATFNADGGLGSGSAIISGGWGLWMSGDTFSNDWTFMVYDTFASTISRIVINAMLGDTVFDAKTGDMSPDSYSGTATHLYEGTATYSNPVSVGGIFYGDLYGMLDITLTTPLGGGDRFSFSSDTDNLSITGDITPTETPEPSTIFLFATGIFGLIAARKFGKHTA